MNRRRRGIHQAAGWRPAVLRRALGLLVVAVLVGFPPQESAAQGQGWSDPLRFARWPLDDLRALEGLGWETGAAMGGLGALVIALVPQDSAVTVRASEIAARSNPYVVRVVEEIGNIHAARPVALMIFVGTLFTEDAYLQDAAFTSLEAVLFADVTTRILKAISGRSRPWEEDGSTHFRPFAGGTSFPSGHSTVAFALVTPWVAYYPGPWTSSLLVLSAGTAATRILLRHHWLTDALAGAAVGTTVGYALARRHLRMGNESIDLVPAGNGGPGVTLQLRF